MCKTARRVCGWFAKKNRLLGSVFFALAALPLEAPAEYHEIDQVKPFGLIGVDGHVRVGYLFDERDRSSIGTDSAESQASWEEEFYLLTRSFVYHPGFLNMDIGGGPVFVQHQFDSLDTNGSNSETLFNFESRLNFLDLKTYPFTLYYEQRHPSVTRGLAGRFIVRNQEYGFRGALQRLFTDRTGVTVDLRHAAAEGSGFGYSVDDETEQARFAAQTSYRDSDRISFTYDRTDLNSASGSPGLPIHFSTQEQKLSQLRFDNTFGSREQFELFQLLTRLQRDLTNSSNSTLDDRRYRGRLTWNYDEMTRSDFMYNYGDSQRTSTESQSRQAQLSLVRRLDDRAVVEAGLEQFKRNDTGFTSDENAINGRATYTQDIGFGTLSLGAGLRKATTDQESSVDEIPVFDESLVLAGTTPVDLVQEFVVPGSIIVRNATNTQTYVENSDYRLIQTGSVTSIQRLIDGNITDGETVLVDYQYATSGTAEFDTLDSNISATISFLQNLSAYVRYNSMDTDVRSGELTNRVNDRDRVEFGLDMTSRALDGWALSGYYRHVQQDEDVSPFVSDSIYANLTKSLWGRLRLSVSAGFTTSDFEASDEDIDNRSYTLGLGGSPFRGAVVNYFVSYFEDVGGTVPRTQLRHRLNVQWGYRMMRVTLFAETMDEELGPSTRTDSRVTMQVVRDF